MSRGSDLTFQDSMEIARLRLRAFDTRFSTQTIVQSPSANVILSVGRLDFNPNVQYEYQADLSRLQIEAESMTFTAVSFSFSFTLFFFKTS